MNLERSSNISWLSYVFLAVFVTVVLSAQTVLAGPTATVYKSPT